jgi:hypothetical protein
MKASDIVKQPLVASVRVTANRTLLLSASASGYSGATIGPTLCSSYE